MKRIKSIQVNKRLDILLFSLAWKMSGDFPAVSCIFTVQKQNGPSISDLDDFTIDRLSENEVAEIQPVIESVLMNFALLNEEQYKRFDGKLKWGKQINWGLRDGQVSWAEILFF